MKYLGVFPAPSRDWSLWQVGARLEQKRILLWRNQSLQLSVWQSEQHIDAVVGGLAEDWPLVVRPSPEERRRVH